MSATSSPSATHEAARRFSLRHVEPTPKPRTYGEYLADRIAAVVGSWRFIIRPSALLALWLVLNVVGWVEHWDPYPFILLNLVLSLPGGVYRADHHDGADRQSDIDRHKAQLDYDVNLRAELDITALHQKLDLLREQDIARLIGLLETLTKERLAGGPAAKIPGSAARRPRQFLRLVDQRAGLIQGIMARRRSPTSSIWCSAARRRVALKPAGRRRSPA